MATQQSVRYINARRALDALFREGPRSRAELSRSLGMTRSATGDIIADLEESGLVAVNTVPASQRRPRTGRPGLDVAINPGGASFVGAEIAVDRLSVVVIDLAARVTIFRVADRESGEPNETVNELVQLIDEVRCDAPDSGPLRGICICLPALLRSDGTVINGLLLNWRDVPLQQMLIARLGTEVPVAIENDAKAFAVAETYGRSDERDRTHAVFLIEVGVGGGLILGGHLFRGSNGLAGELGQLLLGGEGFDPTGRARPGHLESYVGRDALLARWRQAGGPSDGTLTGLLAALDAADGPAIEAARDWGEQLAKGLVQATTVINPDSIILGGSVSPVFAHVSDIVEEGLKAELLDGYPAPAITLSSHGLKAPALGAAHLVHQQLFRIDAGAFAEARPEDLGLPLRITMLTA